MRGRAASKSKRWFSIMGAVWLACARALGLYVTSPVRLLVRLAAASSSQPTWLSFSCLFFVWVVFLKGGNVSVRQGVTAVDDLS